MQNALLNGSIQRTDGVENQRFSVFARLRHCNAGLRQRRTHRTANQTVAQSAGFILLISLLL